jgi:hypothetical protein
LIYREQNVRQGKAKEVREQLIEKRREFCNERGIPFQETANTAIRRDERIQQRRSHQPRLRMKKSFHDFSE